MVPSSEVEEDVVIEEEEEDVESVEEATEVTVVVDMTSWVVVVVVDVCSKVVVVVVVELPSVKVVVVVVVVELRSAMLRIWAPEVVLVNGQLFWSHSVLFIATFFRQVPINNGSSCVL